jgi:predicted DNA-binding transcriptional regulator YafY
MMTPSDSLEANQAVNIIELPSPHESVVALVRDEAVDSGEQPNGKAASKRAMNSTAYRIFKLLQWLIQSPLSVEALNARFLSDPLIGKPVSNDSIWLYINTLKSLGCNIGRPSPKNNFQYEMISHPFGLALTDAQLDSLSHAKAFAQQWFSRQEMQILDSLLKKIVSFSVCDDPDALVEQLFARSRSFDYEELGHHLEQLEQSVSQQQLVRITYLSPKHGQEQFDFLPVSLFYEQGVVYVRGERPKFNHPSSLRVDRILAVTSAEDDALKQRLLERQSNKTELIIHVFPDEAEEFSGFGLGENKGVYQERIRRVEHGDLSNREMSGCPPYCEVKLLVRECFYVKQKLLLSGVPLRIISPASFREDLRQTLETMRKFYQSPVQNLTEGEEIHG